MESEPEKNRAVFDEDFKPEEGKECVGSAHVEKAAEVSKTVAEFLEDKEDSTGDISGDAIKDVTEEVALSDTNAIKERT